MTTTLTPGTRVYLTARGVTYRAEIVGYDAARGRYSVRYYCPAAKAVLLGDCVAPSALAVADVAERKSA